MTIEKLLLKIRPDHDQGYLRFPKRVYQANCTSGTP